MQELQQKEINQSEFFIMRRPLPSHLQIPKRILISSLDQTIKFVEGEWSQFGMHQIVICFQQWNTGHMLFLNKNKEAHILKQISTPLFPRLDQLYIADNLIQSIQSLSDLRAPLLQVIWMHDNLITTLKPLKRCNLPHLAYIRVSPLSLISAQNYLTDCQELSTIQLPFPLSLMLEFNKFGRVQYQDISPLAKLNCDGKFSDEKFLNFSSMHRIHQPSVIKRLQQKVHNLLTAFHKNFPN